VYRSRGIDAATAGDSIHPMASDDTRRGYASRPIERRWSRREYGQLIAHGVLDEDEPIELLDGLLLVKEPQHSRHRTGVLLVAKSVERAFGDGWFVQVQSPIVLNHRSEPEPDVCVVRGSPRDYVDAHPTRPALVVEVADSGLRLLRGRKAAAYARAGIADYWIVNLADRVLEVLREPARPGPARRNWGYVWIETFTADGTIAPLAAPLGPVRVADLLP
jgi:Uma2 family endonuclease